MQQSGEEKKPETKYSSMMMQLGITAWHSKKESGLVRKADEPPDT